MAPASRNPPHPEALRFLPALLELQERPPAPLPRLLVIAGAAFFAAFLVWSCVGRLDVVVVAPGRLVPPSRLQIVQPAEGGVLTELLVADGDAVAQGQPLARLERRAADADREALRARREERTLELHRLDAELAGRRTLAPMRTPPDPARWAQATHELAARLRAQDDRLEAERAAILRAGSDLDQARAQWARIRDSLPLLREQADAWDQLVADGFAGRLQANEKRRAYLESARELEALAAAAAAARSSLAQARGRFDQLVSGRREQLLAERAAARTDLDRLEAEWRRQQVRGEQLELRAPRAGIVKQLATRTTGAVLQPGAVLMTLVPADGRLEAEVRVADEDMGFVRPGQRVQLKVGPYPFTRHGVLTGVVRHVGPDASEERPSVAGPDSIARADPPGGYRVLVALDADALPGHAGPLPLVAGMLVSAELHLGTRTVIEYVTSPVAKTFREAGREL